MTCVDCGTELRESTAKVFTVCDVCWGKRGTPSPPSPTGLEWRVAVQRLLEVHASEHGSLGQAFEQALIADDLTADGQRAAEAYREIKRLLEASR